MRRVFAIGIIFLVAFALQAQTTLQTARSGDPASGVSSVTLITLADFGMGNGQRPNSPLIQGLDGNFYDTTYQGGAWRNGTVFNMTPAGIVTTLYSFCPENNCNAGNHAQAGMTLFSDGNYYGTNTTLGTGNGGTFFQVTPQGVFTVLYNFCSLPSCADGSAPDGPLTVGSDGYLYGTTVSGGANNEGTVFKITPQGVLTTLHSFALSEGASPESLVLATDGNFYGTAFSGGSGAFCVPANNCGTVFKMTPQGVLTKLYDFCQLASCTDGFYPFGFIQAADGNFYGTTLLGGANTKGQGYGTAFKITSKGSFTTLYSFCSMANCADGYTPVGMIQANDGNLYGTTGAGGATTNAGTVFELTVKGALTTLYDFCTGGGTNCPDGAYPLRLLQGTDGSFYGVTYYGGPKSSNYGTAFKLTTGLGKSVKTVTTSGKVGASVIILGTTLTGASKVTFNGVSAAFTVVSSSEITATVPAGAKTGAVVVTTPSASLKSNKNFQVTK